MTTIRSMLRLRANVAFLIITLVLFAVSHVLHLQSLTNVMAGSSALLTLAFLARAVADRLNRNEGFASLSKAGAGGAVVFGILSTRLVGPLREPGHLLLLASLALLAVHVVIGIVIAVRRILAARSPLKDRLTWGLSALIPDNIARMAATELNLLTYVVPYLRRKDVPHGAIAFSYHSQEMPMLLALLAIAFIEAAVTHLLVMNLAAVWRWIIIVLDDACLVYIAAFAFSQRKLPVLLTPLGIHVRNGILLEQWVPMEDIAAIEPLGSTESAAKAATFRACLLTTPSVIIHLIRPIEAVLPIVGKRMIERVTLRPDDASAFIMAVRGTMQSIQLHDGRDAGPVMT